MTLISPSCTSLKDVKFHQRQISVPGIDILSLKVVNERFGGPEDPDLVSSRRSRTQFSLIKYPLTLSGRSLSLLSLNHPRPSSHLLVYPNALRFLKAPLVLDAHLAIRPDKIPTRLSSAASTKPAR